MRASSSESHGGARRVRRSIGRFFAFLASHRLNSKNGLTVRAQRRREVPGCPHCYCAGRRDKGGFAMKFRTMVIAGLLLSLTSGSSLAGPAMLVDLDTGKVLEHEDAFAPWY